MTALDELLQGAPTVLGPGEATPVRRSGSIRRTSTIDATWPDGWGTQMRMLGRARDLQTPSDGSAPVVIAEDVVRVGVRPDRTIEEIASEPARPELVGLIGARGGGRLRAALAEVVPDERSAATPLYLLLDDLAGATLISGFAYSQWPGEWPADWEERRSRSAPMRRMEGICTGFQPGSSALAEDGTARFTHDLRHVAPLPLDDDAIGWHQLDEITVVSMRRARRIDVSHNGDVVVIDAMFQDSATVPAGGRVAVHEYQLRATADLATGVLLTISAEPHVLPYRECPLAASSAQHLVGTPLVDMREAVLDRLPGVAGCTHLNDALRALAEVPALAGRL